MAISELAGVLRGVAEALDRTAFATTAAARPLEEARAALRALGTSDDGWYPAELDLALAELARAAELVAGAKAVVSDYLMRL